MNGNTERGSAIFMLFIAIALFGMLAYAFMQGTRNNISWLTSEQQKTTNYASQDCTNAIGTALKRLEARGCGNLVSYASDGSNLNSGAPSDGSCSVFHPNGGGVKPCNGTATVEACTSGPIGAVCSDAAKYIGDVGSNRIYARAEDAAVGAVAFATGATNTPTSTTNGQANTNTLMTKPGGFTYAAAVACRALGPNWYLPAAAEITLLWTNRVAINLASIGIDTSGTYYWSSSTDGGSNLNAGAIRFSDGAGAYQLKSTTNKVHCVRQ